MHPGKRAKTVVCSGCVLWIFGNCAWEEGDGNFDIVDDIRLPVPRRCIRLEGAEEDVTLVILHLCRASGVEVGEIDNHGCVRDAGGVHAEEELEAHFLGLLVESIEVRSEERPAGVGASIVNGESVDAGSTGEVNVVAIVEVGRLERDHVVGEDKGGRGRLSDRDVPITTYVLMVVSVSYARD